ncbi:MULTISPECIES: hydantoinase/oxoprolinase N-terminal domain-containing protein [unclassified Sphingomonas]|uniref:hydantoinase/oxoprolinase N-terminal domain-containing protein n=1 Tax=unclassified Sphingomonas TaxID=196159 RepID=UPI0006F2DF7A|nr:MULTISPECIES: hydantoinase/oxoprolinase family protein [unclassified Sphingomonas]KQX23415.1 hydantoinase subunit beta [Sphingomonas sp. Root1294]KQY68266.1 hydantoinase subunit beta [Sphingomonas sp. Root50]KRB91165.1 hydantoinase subunit beta [Sphingomonas sp. Root720]
MRIGIDVGGTNTDAVLMDGRSVVGAVKASTTGDVSSGIFEAVRSLIDATAIDVAQIRSVMIGTTHFVNAFVERKNLRPPMILRIGLPAGRGVPPTSGWPADLRAAMRAHVVQVEGGFQFNGAPILPLDERAIAEAARQARDAGLSAVAISCIFSHVDDSMEHRARDIFAQEAPDIAATLSSEVGRVGMLERENAAIINASLVDMGQKVMMAFQSALAQLDIHVPIFVSQNDGTLMSAENAARFPVFTFASGPTNSMRGAAYLSGRRDAIVADIGGTTTDAGVLVKGFPREASLAADFGGVRTNFRMPDVVSVGLGGGSIVRRTGGATTIGPDSVGYRLMREAMVFGGETLTTTDIAVAAGYADVGEPGRVRGLPAEVVKEALAAMHAQFNDAIDRIKSEAADIPLVLVGGGSILISEKIPGTTETIVPTNASVANAIGASIAQVSGEIDRVFLYADHGREGALAEARAEATRRAIEAGATADTVEVVDVLELNLTSMPGDAVRLRVRAVGDLASTQSQGDRACN